MESFCVHFVSPDCREEFIGVCSLTARTSRGEFVIMANHERAVMDLSARTVLLRDEKGCDTPVLVSNAVLSVEENVCTVVSDRVILPGKSYSREKLRILKEEVERMLLSGDVGIIAEQARVDLEFINAVLEE